MSKPLYRVFSKSLLLYITVLMLFLTVVLFFNAVAEVGENGWKTISDLYFIPVLLLIGLLFVNIWLLTSSILPIIKIDNYGISAYSIFWKRKIAWSDISSAALVLCKSELKNGRWAHTSFEHVKIPQQINPLKNKGIKLSTFIIVSSQAIKPKPNLLLSANLLSHHKIATRHEIAFEYEPVAWLAINTAPNK